MMSIPGYDAWKTHNPDDDRCEFCGAHLRECRSGWRPNLCTVAITTETARESPQGVKHYTNRVCHPTHWILYPSRLALQCERDTKQCGECGKYAWLEGDDGDVAGNCRQIGCPLRESEYDLPNDCSCSWRTTHVHSASIDPPETYLQRDPWCPVHGRDPDEAYEAARDDARTFARERAIYGEDF